MQLLFRSVQLHNGKRVRARGKIICEMVVISVSWKELQKIDGGCRQDTHSKHTFGSSVCSQARNAHHAPGSSHTNCSVIFCALEKNLSSSVAHVSPVNLQNGGNPRTTTPTETKLTLRGKWESAFSGWHMGNVPKETHVVSVMTSKPLETVARVRDAMDDRLLMHPIGSQKRLTAMDNPYRNQAVNRKTHLIWVKFHADSNSVKILHFNSGTLPCVWITSLKRMCTWRPMSIHTLWGWCPALQNFEAKWWKRSAASLKESVQ